MTARLERITNYIDGSNCPPIKGNYLDNVEPATGQVYSSVPDSDTHDLERAVSAAERALPKWRASPAEHRAKILYAIADGIERRLEELAQAEAVDNGKPIMVARSLEIPRAATNFRFFAAAVTQFAT